MVLAQTKRERQPPPVTDVLAMAATHEQSARMLREFINRDFTSQLTAALPGPDVELRAHLVNSTLLGLAISRYAVRLETIADADHDTIAAWLGPPLQTLLTGPFPPAPRADRPPAPRPPVGPWSTP